jgi:hypothetical protein
MFVTLMFDHGIWYHPHMWQHIFLILLALGLVACPAAVCESLQTRCAVDEAQECSTDGQWHVLMDCADIEPEGWGCRYDDQEEGHICLPAEE